MRMGVIFGAALRDYGAFAGRQDALVKLLLEIAEQDIQFLSTYLYICHVHRHMTYDYHCPISLHRYACTQRDQRCKRNHHARIALQ